MEKGTGGIRKEMGKHSERLLVQMTSIRVYLEGDGDSSCSGNSLESMRVTLAKSPSKRD